MIKFRLDIILPIPSYIFHPHQLLSQLFGVGKMKLQLYPDNKPQITIYLLR